jgi:hypothetical protein
METVEVTSSTIREVKYDLAKEELIITFKNNAQYLYEGVPPEVFKGLISADSVGKYFDKEIKGKYNFKRLG